jgi:hypothetical protein
MQEAENLKELGSKKTVKIEEEEISKEIETCFYCEKEITSELQALERRVTCHVARPETP